MNTHHDEPPPSSFMTQCRFLLEAVQDLTRPRSPQFSRSTLNLLTTTSMMNKYFIPRWFLTRFWFHVRRSPLQSLWYIQQHLLHCDWHLNSVRFRDARTILSTSNLHLWTIGLTDSLGYRRCKVKRIINTPIDQSTSLGYCCFPWYFRRPPTYLYSCILHKSRQAMG
jgi:hypothetical protein